MRRRWDWKPQQNAFHPSQPAIDHFDALIKRVPALQRQAGTVSAIE